MYVRSDRDYREPFLKSKSKTKVYLLKFKEVNRF